MDSPTHHQHSWIDREQTECKDIALTDLPFISNTIKCHNCFKNTAIAITLTAWWKVNKIKNTTISPTTQTPIWKNPDFTANKSPLTGTKWKEKGITHLHHIFNRNTLLPFQQLIDLLIHTALKHNNS